MLNMEKVRPRESKGLFNVNSKTRHRSGLWTLRPVLLSRHHEQTTLSFFFFLSNGCHLLSTSTLWKLLNLPLPLQRPQSWAARRNSSPCPSSPTSQVCWQLRCCQMTSSSQAWRSAVRRKAAVRLPATFAADQARSSWAPHQCCWKSTVWYHFTPSSKTTAPRRWASLTLPLSWI